MREEWTVYSLSDVRCLRTEIEEDTHRSWWEERLDRLRRIESDYRSKESQKRTSEEECG